MISQLIYAHSGKPAYIFTGIDRLTCFFCVNAIKMICKMHDGEHRCLYHSLESILSREILSSSIMFCVDIKIYCKLNMYENVPLNL